MKQDAERRLLPGVAMDAASGVLTLNGLFWLWSLVMLQADGQPFGTVAKVGGGGISIAHGLFIVACAGDALFMLSI